MPKRKVAVVGGGIAGLTAAFELTKGSRGDDCEVVVFQMGWRLGGKCASGRDDDDRIVEHGLHIWFGYYENAFQLLQEVYEEWQPRRGTKITRWDAVLEGQDFTPVGRPGGKPPFIPLHWPPNSELPGDGASPSFWESIANVLRLLSQFHDARAPLLTSSDIQIYIEANVLAAFQRTVGPYWRLVKGRFPGNVLKMAALWAERVAHVPKERTATNLDGIKYLLRQTRTALLGVRKTADDVLVAEVVDIAAALAGGVIDDIVFSRKPLVELDVFDLREWLILHGAQWTTAFQSIAVKALYDTMFQYCEGDETRPSYAAGTAVQVILRLLGTYKRHAVWKARGSLGETLIAPLYQVLEARSVRFKFFHKLERIALNDSRDAVAELHFALQCEIDDDAYEPTGWCHGFTTWKARPSDEDLESRWGTASVGNLVLKQGVDFDDVVLAIPPGAFRSVDAMAGPCDELLRASSNFRMMSETLGLVPSLSVQVWCNKALGELGWRYPRPAMVSGPGALQIWADMSHILLCEGWDNTDSASLHYFCNVASLQVADSSPAAEKALAMVRTQAIEWFNDRVPDLWTAQRAGAFDWSIMIDPRNCLGESRIEAQMVRANVEPSACCVSSAAGTTRRRLKTDASGFGHLFLAGSWIDTGFNTECIEAAVMSGKQACRAICGEPIIVHGEDFLHARDGSWLDWIYGLFEGLM